MFRYIYKMMYAPMVAQGGFAKVFCTLKAIFEPFNFLLSPLVHWYCK